MRMNLPHNVMEDPKLAAVLMRLADETDQVIEVTQEGVALRREFYAPVRCKRIESLEQRAEERATWAA